MLRSGRLGVRELEEVCGRSLAVRHECVLGKSGVSEKPNWRLG
jgi:hypothetical protein